MLSVTLMNNWIHTALSKTPLTQVGGLVGIVAVRQKEHPWQENKGTP